MPIYRTSGGSILEIDVPHPNTHAHERHVEQITKGELVELDPSTVEFVAKPGNPADGVAYHWVLKDPDSGDIAAPAPAVDEPVPADGDDSVPTDGVVTDAVPDGNIGEVKAWVDGDLDRARAALAAEVERGDEARKGLVSWLEDLLGA